MSQYSNLEFEILEAARNAMYSRRYILNKLDLYKSAGAESWFQWEFVLSPWSEKWNFKKRRPYDLEVLDMHGNSLAKLEIKCCTDKNFNWVSDYLYPNKGTLNKTAQQLRQERRDVMVLFLAVDGIQNNFNNLDPKIFSLPIPYENIGYINIKWIVGILKRV